MTHDSKLDALVDLRTKVVAQGHISGTNCYVAKASGALVYDVTGKEYIDFAGGIAVMNVGHSHPKVVAAIKDQAEQFTHTCFMVLPYEPAVTLANKLASVVPGDFEKSVLFINSGAEAVEGGVKIAKKYSVTQGRTGVGVIAVEGSFHGLLGRRISGRQVQ